MMFLGECTPQKKISPLPKNKQNKEKKQNFSLFPLLFSFLSFLSKFPHNEKLLPFLKVALLFIILSARRTSHLSEHSLERTHHRARKRDILLSVVLCSFNTTIKSVLREKRERRERVVCGYIVACIVLIGEKSTRR